VSMGMTAALKWKRVVRNTRAVLAIEALTAARALEFLRPLKSSVPLERARDRVRSVCVAWEGDHALSGDIAAIEKLIADGMLTVAAVEAE
jgi:histidine ammonia-lyase